MSEEVLSDDGKAMYRTHRPTGICGVCHHVATLHWQRPSCSECRCSRDPICADCGWVASKHVEPEVTQ